MFYVLVEKVETFFIEKSQKPFQVLFVVQKLENGEEATDTFQVRFGYLDLGLRHLICYLVFGCESY